MPLTPGSKLGIYEIVAPLGAGGMGEVYRARDTRLGRDVAIKALPAQFAQDPDRLARFEREAKLLASLSHPHIAGIFGLEDIGGHRYLALEFVEGETLAQRLDHSTLTIDEALQFGRQIASALETAHEQGIAHRDLKPGNVMITTAGDVKVLDFGLAKGGMGSGSGSDVSLTHSPTLTHQHTGAGVIMGTAAYMSPEQARGRAIDKRTDIWSFGCVLFECLTGRQAFAGETVSDLIARILEREPDWDALPSRTPQRIRDLLKRCLEKDSKRRLRDIGDARIEIEDVIATKSSSPEAVAAASRQRLNLRTWLGAAALVLVTAAATYYGAPRKTSGNLALPTRFEIPEMPGTRMDIDGANSVISPDGRTLAYIATDSIGVPQVWIRPLDSLVARKLTGANQALIPFWSPDSRTLGYFTSDQAIMKISLSGGEPERIVAAKGFRGASWSRDGVILYAPLSDGPLYRVSANGGDGVQVTELDSLNTAHRFPCFLPDGKRFLYVALPPREGRYRIYVSSLDNPKERRLVLESGSNGVVYAPEGYLVYDREGVIVAHRFDVKKAAVLGEPVALGDRLLSTGFSGAPALSVSQTGTLAYSTNSEFATHLIWTDRNGRQTGRIPVAPGKYTGAEISPNGKEAVLQSSDRIGVSELWLANLERGVVTRLSYDEGENSNARWSPDGTRVAYTAGGSGSYQRIIVVNVNGGASRAYLADDPVFKSVSGWTPDGKSVIYARQNPTTRWDIWILPIDGETAPRPYLVTPYYEDRGRVSPDGRWLVYRSNESGRFDLYVQAFPDGGSKYKVTTQGGEGADWSRDGRQLIYGRANDFNTTAYAAEVRASAGRFDLGPESVYARVPNTSFDVEPAADGGLMVLMPVRPLPPQSVTIVQNWPALVAGK